MHRLRHFHRVQSLILQMEQVRLREAHLQKVTQRFFLDNSHLNTTHKPKQYSLEVSTQIFEDVWEEYNT